MEERGAARNLLVATFFCVLCLYAAPKAAAAFRNVEEGAEAPAFRLKDAAGNEVSLDAYKKEKAVVLVFFATWSERALTELADLRQMSKTFEGKGLKILAVNVEHEHTSEEDRKAILGRIAPPGPDFQVLFDAGLETYRNYGVVAVPSTAVLGEGAVVRGSFNGYPTFARQDLQALLEQVMGLVPPGAAKPATAAKADNAYRPGRPALLNYNLGRTLLARGMPDKAEHKLRAAADADPKWCAPHILLGDIRLLQGKKDPRKLEEAKKEFLSAVAAEPENVVARTGLARVYWRLGAAAEAEREVDEALKRNASYPPAMLVKAALAGRKGGIPAAEKWIGEAIALNPRDPEAHSLAGRAYEEAGGLAKAAAMYRKAWDLGGE